MQATLCYGGYTLPLPITAGTAGHHLCYLFKANCLSLIQFPSGLYFNKGAYCGNNYNFLVKKNWNFKHSTVLELSLGLSETAKPVARQAKTRFG